MWNSDQIFNSFKIKLSDNLYGGIMKFKKSKIYTSAILLLSTFSFVLFNNFVETPTEYALLGKNELSLASGKFMNRGNFQFLMQGNGDFVVKYKVNGVFKVIWRTKTTNQCSNCVVQFTSQGALQLSQNTEIVFSTKTDVPVLDAQKIRFSNKSPFVEVLNSEENVIWTQSETISKFSLKPNQYLQVGAEDQKIKMIYHLASGDLFVRKAEDNQLLYRTSFEKPCDSTCRATFTDNGSLVMTIQGQVYGAVRLNKLNSYFKFNFDEAPHATIRDQYGRILWPKARLTPLGGQSDIVIGSHTYELPQLPYMYDYIVQKVCLDENNQVTPEDPYTCTKKRNLRVGEDLPYSRYNSSTVTNALGEIVSQTEFLHNNNIPHLKGYKSHVVSVREWTAAAGANRAFRDFDVLGGDGYDVVEANGAYSSGVGTRDPITTSADFVWWNNQCQPEDGWVLFPNDILKDFSLRSIVAYLTGGNQCDPAQGFSDSLTTFQRLAEFEFANGKKMPAVVSNHYGRGDTQMDLFHIERFYMTSQYGMSRWERWETAQGCVLAAQFHNQDPNVFCDQARIQKINESWIKTKSCTGSGFEDLFGQRFFRTGCSDWTDVKPLDTPIHAFNAPMTATFVTSRNLLQSADFANRQIGGWQRMVAPFQPDWAFKENSRTKNISLALSCNPQCAAHSLYQDVDPRSVVSEYGGGELKIQVGALMTGLSGAVADVVVHLQELNGTVHQRKVRINFETGVPASLRYNFNWNFAAYPLQNIRYQVYLNGAPYNPYTLDETFLAILPK